LRCQLLSLPTMSKEPLVGQLLGHYRLLEQIGAGGMGVVYRAHDEHLNRDVAAKVLPAGSLANEETRKRFKQEAHALARLNHPNIATIFDFDCEGTTDFLVMELLNRQTLADKLLGPLPPNVVIKYGIQMAEGLAAAHQQGILHRDLKPGNLGLTAEGRVKLLDFGLAKLLTTDPADVTQSMTGVGLAKGTLAYMAPEQLRGENIDTRVDIYAAGSVLYEMATGKRPHPQVGPLLINAILNQPPVPPSTLNQAVNPALEAITLKALQKDPKLRYQSAKELAADLERLNTATVPVALRQASRQRFRQSLPHVMLVAGVLILAIVSWQISRRLQVRPTEGPRPTLLVGDFENKTGEPVFDNTLREMFTSSLEQSHLVQVFPTSRLVDVLRRMGLPPSQAIDEKTGQEICLREGGNRTGAAQGRGCGRSRSEGRCLPEIRVCDRDAGSLLRRGRDARPSSRTIPSFANPCERVYGRHSHRAFDEPAFHRTVDAHYRLGVLYQKLGRWSDSRTELQKFLGYWSHADADLAIYQDAQRLLRSLPAGNV